MNKQKSRAKTVKKIKIKIKNVVDTNIIGTLFTKRTMQF